MTYIRGTIFKGKVIISSSGNTPSVYWQANYAEMIDTSATSQVRDSTGNIYLTVDDQNNFDSYILKYDTTGTLVWQFMISGVAGIGGLIIDASDNLYINININSGGTVDSSVIKLTSNCNIVWQTKIVSGNSYVYVAKMTLDSSGNIYFCGTEQAGLGIGFIVKLDSTGSVLWQSEIGGSYPNLSQINTLEVDTTGNSYAIGTAPRVGDFNSSDMCIIKYNASGSVISQLSYPVAVGSCQPFSSQIDSSNNLYISGYTGTTAFLIKLNSSGSIIWQVALDGVLSEISSTILLDGSGNIYMAGFKNISSVQTGFIIKFNSSGTIVWQRDIGTTLSGSISTAVSKITVNGSDMYISVSMYDNTTSISYNSLIRLPNDGSLTGTYGNLVYSTGYSGIGSITVTPVGLSATISAGNISLSTLNYTLSVSSLTSITTSIP